MNIGHERRHAMVKVKMIEFIWPKKRWKARSVGIIRVFMKSKTLIDYVERVYMVDNIERTYWESFWKNAYVKYKDL